MRIPEEPPLEICKFGDRNECVLDELLRRMDNLDLGYRNQCTVLKRVHAEQVEHRKLLGKIAKALGI